jgi:hypothetical protein
VSPFVRKVKTASGATAVQIVEKRNGQRRILEHVGSAHDEAELAVLVSAAQQRLHGVQDMLELEPVPRVSAGPVVEQAASRLLCQVLEGAYRQLGFGVIGDDMFARLVLARLVEPVSKLDSIRVLGQLGVGTPHPNSLYKCLARCVKRDYRGRLAEACWAYATSSGPVALVMYDLTTLHFQIEAEDHLRKVGMSKERRVDPQVTVGLLVTADGFPLEVAMFEGNKGETKTLIPVINQFKARHHLSELVVVADAGMLSAANLNALEDAGCTFIVASRQSHVPYDLGEHFERHGNYVADGATIETGRDMGAGKDRRSRRVVYQYSFARHKREDRTINAQIAKAEKVAAGQRPIARDRFVTVTGNGAGKKAEVNWDTIERARFCAGFKGYVTNLATDVMDGPAVIAAYHDLWHVEESFRMAKSDLQARPIFHHKKDSIEAHLTTVFAALAVARYLQARTGVTIKRLVHTLRPLQDVTISIAGRQIVAQPRIDPDTAAILDKVPDLTGH